MLIPHEIRLEGELDSWLADLDDVGRISFGALEYWNGTTDI